LDGAYQSGRKQLFMMFHSFELLGAAALWQIWVGGPSWVTVAFLAALVHLVCDVFANPAKPLSYFLVFRAAKGFRRELLVNEISASAGSRERVLQGQKTVAVADKALESSANARGDSDH
jgi:hypothetical protein